MAVTDIHPISTTVNLAVDYIINPQKTKNGELVSSVGCSLNGTKCAKEFDKIRSLGTGRGTTLAQHLFQSFAPGETTPEQAHQLGIELANNFLKGQYQYIIATHVDKEHIHNHIIFNNIGYEHFKSFEYVDNRGGNVFKKLQVESDKICKENGLSVIENPELEKGKSYYEWLMNNDGQSWKSKLKFELDNCIMNSTSFDDFLQNCKQRNIECVYRPENVITLKFRMEGQQKFCRAKTLGWWYEEPQIRRRIVQFQRTYRNKFIDTNTKKMQENKGLKRWAEIQNMKEASKLLNYLSEHGYANLEQLENDAISKYGERVELVAELNELQNRIDILSQNIKLIQQYLKYKPYNDELKKTKFKAKYEKQNAEELKKYNVIKSKLSEKFPNRQLPNIEKLYDDRAELITLRNEKNNKYRNLSTELKELDKVRAEVERYVHQQSEHKKSKEELY